MNVHFPGDQSINSLIIIIISTSRHFPPWRYGAGWKLAQIMFCTLTNECELWFVAFPSLRLFSISLTCSLFSNLLNYRRFDLFLCHFAAQISPGRRLHEHPLKRTKWNFGTNETRASSTWRGWSWKNRSYTNFLGGRNCVSGDVSICGGDSVRCRVNVTSEHSDDTVEWLSHVPWIGWIVQVEWECVRKTTLRCCTTALDSNAIVY